MNKTALFKVPSQTLHKHRGDFPEPQQIGFAHFGYSDVDQRLIDGTYDFSSILENAMLDLSSYCEQHGYTYMRVVFSRPEDKMWGYGKALAIKAALQEVQLLVVCDFDVAVADFHVPLEGILAGWGFTSAHLVLAPEDPDRPYNQWSREEDGAAAVHTNLNIGFMVLRNHEKVMDSLELFDKCVDIVPGCGELRWGEIFPDQTAWNKFILPTFLPSEVLKAPCNESNGYNHAFGNNDGCEGLLVSHAWTAKPQLGEMVRARILHRLYASAFSPLQSALSR